MNEFDMTQFGAVRPLPVYRSPRSWRGALAALKARLEQAWVGLYAPPPRRALPDL